jgi:uncharacterized coiled-coil protein SlyX
MDSLTINNPVFNDQFAGQLASSGHELIGTGLVLLQIIVLPVAMYFIKGWQAGQKKQIEELNAAHKKNIDLETENRKLIRDQQMEKLENRIGILEKDNNHKIDDMSKQMENLNGTMKRLFDKFDKLTDKFEDVIIRLVKVEK